MQNDLHAFEQFMKRREEASRAYVSGDAAPLGRVIAHESPATFFGPQGGYRQGADEVRATYERDAESFAPGSDSHFEILHMAASDGIAYWVGFSVPRHICVGKLRQYRSTYGYPKCFVAKVMIGN